MIQALPAFKAVISGGIRYLLRATFGADLAVPKDEHGTNHLTKNGPITSVAGKVGNAAQFTAASSTYLSIADNADLSMGDIDFLVGCWVNPDTLGTTRTLLCKGTRITPATTEYVLFQAATGAIILQVSNGTTAVSKTSTTLLTAGAWAFVLAWHDAANDTLNIQINNGAVESGATGGVFAQDSTQQFRIGARSDGFEFYEGRIDAAFVSKRILTAQERTDLYNFGNGLSYSDLTTAHKVGLVSWWSLDDVQMPASLPVDVGGPVAVVDASNVMHITGGEWVGDGAASALLGESTTRPRVAGRAAAVRLRRSVGTADMYLRLIAGFNTEQIRLQASGLRVTSDLLVDPSYLSFLGPLDLLIVSRGTGSYAFSRNVTSGAYTLQWIENTATAAIQPRISNTASAAGRINYFDNFRVLDLAPLDSRFATDYGLATSRLVSPIAGATTTSEADAVIETTITTLPSAGAITLRLRMQDAQNHWEVDLQSSGAMTLYERVANVPTARGNAAAVLVNGSQVVITLEGSVIKGYSDNVLRWTYSSATSFQTLTANEVATLGTGGVVSQITCWPRFVTLRSDL